ncbi:MAG: hypothetical protein MUO41_08165 [Methyloceanibacter sp.]|nr:hypothetical protein [Methyloceanibacter sp.]
MAQRFVAATLKDLAAEGRLRQLNQELPLQLKHLRHVRIMYMDDLGQLAVVSPQPDVASAEPKPYVPGWFAALVRPQLPVRAVKVVTAEQANPIIVGEPFDEIAEAWQDFSALAIVWLSLNALILAVLYVVLGRVLDPLAHLSKGMLNLEEGHYGTRLEPPKVKNLPSSPNASTRLPARSIRRARRTAGFIASSSPYKSKNGAPSPTRCTTRRDRACSVSPPMPHRSRTSSISCPMSAPAKFPAASARFCRLPSG